MGTWQPPVPQGALTSRALRDLGPARSIIDWCWENVRRDGWCTVRLKEIAAEMDEPYHTVTKWWARVLDAEVYFSEIEDHGKNGYRVRMASEWLDWRVLEQRGGPAVNHSSITRELPDHATETRQPEQAPAQSLVNDSSITRELPSPATDTIGIKVLNLSEQHAAPAAADAAPSPPARTKKPQKAKADEPAPEEPVTPAVIRSALADVCLIGKTSSAEVRKDAASRAKAIWRAYRDTRTDEEIAADIRYVGEWCLTGAWQCKDGSAPRPKLIGDYWDQAMADRRKKQARTAAPVIVAEPYDYDNEPSPYAAREAQRAARRNGSHP